MKRTARLRPKKRPAQERSRRTVACILKGAAQIFAERGYANTSTNHIAERAGVSIGSLYQYFPCKEAILLALAESHVERVFAAGLERLRRKRQTPIPELLESLVDGLVRAHRAEPGLHRVIFEEARVDAPFRVRLDELNAAAIAVAREVIEERCAELVIDNWEMASFLVVQVLEGVIHTTALRNPEVLGKVEFRRELVRLLASYLTGAQGDGLRSRSRIANRSGGG